MDSCFGLVGPHQHGLNVGQKKGLKALCTLPFTAEAVQSTPSSASSAMLMRPNKADTAVHGCHCAGDMDKRMHKILATSGQTVGSCSSVSLAFIVIFFCFVPGFLQGQPPK